MNYSTSNPTAFLMEVDNPEEFGVVELKNENIISVEEKPKNPNSNLIAVGLYYLDSNSVQILDDNNMLCFHVKPISFYL